MQGVFAWEAIGVLKTRQWYPYGCVAIEHEYDDETD